MGRLFPPPLSTPPNSWPFGWLRGWQTRRKPDNNRKLSLASGEDTIKQFSLVTMATPNPEPGDVIEEYEILERIGGNMGYVFRARHRLLDKVVVLKLVPTESITDPSSLTRFQREMRVMGKLEHPNLVTAADARSVGGWHLVAMEWIDGADLQQLVRARGPLPVAAACEVARQAAQALQYAHEHGLIHRDIKPSNLMLTRSGTLKVIDMGLALIREDSAAQLTKTGLVLGTMSYCAPEQFRDASHVDIRADIYSLGCTLYHLLTGKPPYSERKSFAEVVEAHLHEPFPGLAEAPDAPVGLEAVLARMTAKDREARFSTPGEVAEALEPFASGADLKPLVPERTPEVPTVRIKDGKVTTNREGQRRSASGEQGGDQQAKARWTRRAALFGLGGAAAGAVMLHRCGTDNDAGTTVPHPGRAIFLMDTFAPRGIYNPTNVKKGRTNADELRERLPGLDGIQSNDLMKEGIGLDWRGDSFVASLSPRIVIIHRSSFFHPMAAEMNEPYPDEFGGDPVKLHRWQDFYGAQDLRLQSFIKLVGVVVPHTQFLIYSTGTDARWLKDDYRADWIKKLESETPALEGRITTMVIPKQPDPEKGGFRDPATMEKVRGYVREMIKKADQKVKESSPEKSN